MKTFREAALDWAVKNPKSIVYYHPTKAYKSATEVGYSSHYEDNYYFVHKPHKELIHIPLKDILVY